MLTMRCQAPAWQGRSVRGRVAATDTITLPTHWLATAFVAQSATRHPCRCPPLVEDMFPNRHSKGMCHKQVAADKQVTAGQRQPAAGVVDPEPTSTSQHTSRVEYARRRQSRSNGRPRTGAGRHPNSPNLASHSLAQPTSRHAIVLGWRQAHPRPQLGPASRTDGHPPPQQQQHAPVGASGRQGLQQQLGLWGPAQRSLPTGLQSARASQRLLGTPTLARRNLGTALLAAGEAASTHCGSCNVLHARTRRQPPAKQLHPLGVLRRLRRGALALPLLSPSNPQRAQPRRTVWLQPRSHTKASTPVKSRVSAGPWQIKIGAALLHNHSPGTKTAGSGRPVLLYVVPPPCHATCVHARARICKAQLLALGLRLTRCWAPRHHHHAPPMRGSPHQHHVSRSSLPPGRAGPLAFKTR